MRTQPQEIIDQLEVNNSRLAKEAIIKAIKSSGINIPIEFNSIVVLNKSDGAPYVELD